MVIHDKKGDLGIEIFYTMIQVLLAVALIVFGFIGLNSHADSSQFHRTYYANDISLILDALHATPGDAVIDYDVEQLQKPMQFYIADGQVSIYDYGESNIESRVPIAQQYGSDNTITVRPSNSLPTKLRFTKKGNEITIEAVEEVLA